MKPVKIGDYVLATKYSDGDPKDGWAVGYVSQINEDFGLVRYIVVDNEQKVIGLANGFRRARRIKPEKGKWIVRNAQNIEKFYGYSMWHLFRTKLENLPTNL